MVKSSIVPRLTKSQRTGLVHFHVHACETPARSLTYMVAKTSSVAGHRKVTTKITTTAAWCLASSIGLPSGPVIMSPSTYDLHVGDVPNFLAFRSNLLRHIMSSLPTREGCNEEHTARLPSEKRPRLV
ncbi:hypothetical protein KC325_g277 [Hortaea werneckii]|nr:hypothetical protein KC325_g277 [Hortaea werneckii]